MTNRILTADDNSPSPTTGSYEIPPSLKRFVHLWIEVLLSIVKRRTQATPLSFIASKRPLDPNNVEVGCKEPRPAREADIPSVTRLCNIMPPATQRDR